MENRKYTIKQIVNDKFISKIDVISNADDIKAFEEFILLPQKGELIKEFYRVKMQLKDQEGRKVYINFAMPIEKNERALMDSLIGRFYSVEVHSIYIFLMSRDTYTYQNYINNQKKGKTYEEFIYSLLLKKDYSVFHNCLEMGKNDKGIDFIAQKDETILLIQCKHWEEMNIEHTHLKEFFANCQLYLSKTKLKGESKNIRLLYITSKHILSPSAKIFLNENPNLIEHHVISM